MTADLDGLLDVDDALADLEFELPHQALVASIDEVEELACKAHLGVWTARRRMMDMAALHWEWCELAMTESRLCLVAPREHSKSETFSINATVWRSTYTPGLWTYIFCQTGEQGEAILERIKMAMEETCPELVENARVVTTTRLVFSNGARVNVAGSGKAVRGAHPDIVLGDDVLDEGNTMTELQRKRTERWWLGTVGGMVHPGTVRKLRLGGGLVEIRMPPTRVFLVGTPFHELDLLMRMRSNKMYRFRRYAAEFKPTDLVGDSLAVEAN